MRRAASRSAAAAVGDFSAVRVIPHASGKALVSASTFAAADELFRFTGVLRRDNIGDRSLMVGREAHLVSHDEEEAWVYLNHSFSPSVSIHHPPVNGADAVPPLLTATAIVDIEEGEPLTIDYTLHEWEMHAPFTCGESGREVRGFKYLTETEQDAALPSALPHIRSLHLQHLFGQSSRC